LARAARRASAMSGAIISREVPFMLVVNPPELGAARWRGFEAHLATCAGPLPPVKRIGVNKNWLDFSKSKRRLRFDNRSPLTKARLKLGLTKNRIDFAARYDKHFSGAATSKNSAPGIIACALSHIEAWELIVRELNAEQAAVVVEDDARIQQKLDFTTVRIPADADILHFRWPLKVKPPAAEFATFVKNWRTTLYFVTRDGAQKLLDGLPLKFGRQIDDYMFSEDALSAGRWRVYAPTKFTHSYLPFSVSLIQGRRFLSDFRLMQGLYERYPRLKRIYKKINTILPL